LPLGELKILQEIPGSNIFTANLAKKLLLVGRADFTKSKPPTDRAGIAVWAGMCL